MATVTNPPCHQPEKRCPSPSPNHHCCPPTARDRRRNLEKPPSPLHHYPLRYEPCHHATLFVASHRPPSARCRLLPPVGHHPQMPVPPLDHQSASHPQAAINTGCPSSSHCHAPIFAGRAMPPPSSPDPPPAATQITVVPPLHQPNSPLPCSSSPPHHHRRPLSMAAGHPSPLHLEIPSTSHSPHSRRPLSSMSPLRSHLLSTIFTIPPKVPWTLPLSIFFPFQHPITNPPWLHHHQGRPPSLPKSCPRSRCATLFVTSHFLHPPHCHALHHLPPLHYHHPQALHASIHPHGLMPSHSSSLDGSMRCSPSAPCSSLSQPDVPSAPTAKQILVRFWL